MDLPLSHLKKHKAILLWRMTLINVYMLVIVTVVVPTIMA